MTVWQKTSLRDGFVQSRTRPVFLIIASMIGALAVIVWFGVRRGLAPLLDLEDAIARRSPTDLTPIQRRIPQEVNGIVGRFNNLLNEVSQSFDAKNAFISDAAHQLRNPITGVQSLAESIANAKSLEDAKARSADLLIAARETGQLANNLLTLEKARAASLSGATTTFDPIEIVAGLTAWADQAAKDLKVTFTANLPDIAVPLNGDPVMFEQAVLNLINNALTHGGETMTEIKLDIHQTKGALEVTVADDGKGIAPKNFNRALERFSQIGPSAGSGLGLPIAKTVVESFQGNIALGSKPKGFTVSLSFPKN